MRRTMKNVSESFRALDGAIVVRQLPRSFGVDDVAVISDTVFKLIRSGQKDFIFDLDCVENVSIAAVAFLDVTREKLAKVGGDFKLINLSDRVVDILRVYRMYHKFRGHLFRLDDVELCPVSTAPSLPACGVRGRDNESAACQRCLTAVAVA